MISNPTSLTPLPRLEYTITSRNPDLRDHTLIAETAHRALHYNHKAKQDGDTHTYPEYPEIPRLVVLSREEAGEMGVPGFKIKIKINNIGEASGLGEEGAGAGAEDEIGTESEDRIEIEVGNVEIGKELAILQVEEEDPVLRSRSRDAKFKLRSEGWQVKTSRKRRRGWWDSTFDGWAGKSTVSSSSSSSSSGGETELARETVEGGMQWEEEGVTVLPGTTVRITSTASLMILVPDPQRRRNELEEAS